MSNLLAESGDQSIDWLSKRIDNLSPPDRLRLAAELLEGQRPRLAYLTIAQVVADLALVLERHGVSL